MNVIFSSLQTCGQIVYLATHRPCITWIMTNEERFDVTQTKSLIPISTWKTGGGKQWTNKSYSIYIYIELHDKVQMKGFRYILDGKVNFLRLGWFFMCECVIYIFLQRGGWRSSKLIVLLLLVFLWLFSYTTFHSNHFYAWGDGCKCFFFNVV